MEKQRVAEWGEVTRERQDGMRVIRRESGIWLWRYWLLEESRRHWNDEDLQVILSH